MVHEDCEPSGNTAKNSSAKSIHKPLGVFSLVMMNVMAVDSLRSLPVAAEFGYSLLFFYLLAAVFFFIPTALVTAELATAWPSTGGAYIWIRNAFGARWGWFAIWLQWIYNVVWYPTILAFVIATMAYLFNPQLVHHKGFVLGLVLCIWWSVTGFSCLGLRVSSWFSSVGALIGTLIPMFFIIALALFWIKSAKPLAIHFSSYALFPTLKDFKNLSFLTTIVFGLMGLEMSAVHAGDVHNPQKNYPRALLCSAGLILLTLMLGSLAIALIVPAGQLSLLTGLTDAYVVFFTSYHLEFLIPLLIALIIIGSLCSVSTWVIGPTRGLFIATAESQISGLRWFLTLNRFGAPVNLLLLQGILVSLLASLFILIPTVNEAYWMLSVMTAQLAVLFYILLFLAALCLRYKEGHQARVYRIPGGTIGIFFTTGLGLLTCLTIFIIGFFPPAVVTGSFFKFDSVLVLGILFFCLPLYFIGRARRNNNEMEML